jgi:hypothetical protein
MYKTPHDGVTLSHVATWGLIDPAFTISELSKSARAIRCLQTTVLWDVQDKATACISPAEVLDVSSAQLAKVAYLVTRPNWRRRVAGLYIASDPWSLMTCVITETPNNTWSSSDQWWNQNADFYVNLFSKVS